MSPHNFPVADPASASSDTEPASLPVSPSLASALPGIRLLRPAMGVDGRVVFLSLIAMALAAVSALIARLLAALIGLVTNLAYYGRISTAFVSPSHHHLGWWALFVPVFGGLIVGAMARYGSRAIRGHGIPEAMEQVLVNESRIAPRLTFLKPLSAAVAIGTGGPFGAEGPIIATGGALGSLIGQLLHTTAMERKTLLAAGAAAGMTATFGCPIAAVLLAVELLLFEFRPRSLIPVALASATATGVRFAYAGSAPVFPMPDLPSASGAALGFYLLLGLLLGLAAVGVTRLVYAVEDGFERLPISWVWWPALGGLAVGAVGLMAPRTLGVGYDNIEQIVDGTLAGRTLLFLCLLKLISWAISLGSGTSGGTLAPLFTIGGGLGAVLGGVAAALLPQIGVDARLAALVGMAAIFAGASRALLASVVFAFETTQEPAGLLPLLAGCAAAYLISSLLMKNTIMTEKIARRGIPVPSEYEADFLAQVRAGAFATRNVVSLKADETLANVLKWLECGGADAQHQGYPVLDEQERLRGVITRRDLLNAHGEDSMHVRDLIQRPPVIIFEDNTLREAADQMVIEGVGRLPVVSRAEPRRLLGILTRSDLLAAHARRLAETHHAARHLPLPDVRALRLQKESSE